MTNASISKTIKALSVIALSVVFSVGVFATTVHAQEDLGYADFSGDNLGYADTYGDNLGYADTYGDNLGYGDTYGTNLGYGDTYGDNVGYGDTYGDNLGYGDTYGTDTYGTDTYGTDTFGTDTYGTDYTYENGVGYSYNTGFSAPTSFGTSYSYPSTPISFNAPSYHPISYPAPVYPTPAPVHPTPVVTTPVTNNNCVNNSCNTTNVNNNSNTNIVNSGNTTVATVVPVVAQPIVQYVQPQPQPTYYAQPSCTISITNYNGNNYGPNAYSQLATITWSSQNAINGYISPNVGSVSGWGSMQVYPTNGQTYTMTVYSQGGSATCSTQPFYTYVAPIVNNPTPYVSLSQIPYTGFDFGALGNSIYWLSLVVFAGAAAYLVLYFNGGALAILGGNRSRKSTIAMPKITVSKAPAVTAKVETPVVSPIQISTPAVSSRNTSDTMHVAHSKGGSMPSIRISRE